VTRGVEYLTVSESALWLHRSERTIKRWMNARLLAVYRRADGKLVLAVADLARVERAQRRANVARNRSGRPRRSLDTSRVDAGG
jgi:hypothetical protein